MSPEIVSREPYNPFKSDVWSLGVLLYLMLHGIYPFFSTDESVLFSKIQKGRYKVGDFISSDAREVLRETLIINP
jgi:serine/threonine protein kinase